MAGGNGTTMKVSAALRKAGLPVLRWSDAADHLTRRGIYVSSESPDRAHVGLHFSDKPHGVREERDTADAIEAVLLARGFAYTRHTVGADRNAYSFTVYRTNEDPMYRAYLAANSAPQPEAPATPEQVVTAASPKKTTTSKGLTMRISATLRAAGLPVVRYSDRIGGRSRYGVKVSRNGATHADISIKFEEGYEEERRTADEIEAILFAKGFIYTRFDLEGGSGPFVSFNVYVPHHAPSQATNAPTTPDTAPDPAVADDPEQAFIKAEDAAIAASGLDVSRSTRKDWFVKHDGRRNAYYIERTGGTSTRTRYSVTAHGSRQIAKGLRTLAEALAAVQTDIDTPEA